MSIWLDQTDLENAMSVATVAAIFDDANTGTLNTHAMNGVIERAEQEVLSWLVGQYGPNIQQDQDIATDMFLKGCSVEYAVAFAFDRHPEYVRANGKERGERFERAQSRMERVLQARQRVTTAPKIPLNVGGVTVDDSRRIIVSNSDGTYNSGDF